MVAEMVLIGGIVMGNDDEFVDETFERGHVNDFQITQLALKPPFQHLHLQLVVSVDQNAMYVSFSRFAKKQCPIK